MDIQTARRHEIYSGSEGCFKRIVEREELEKAYRRLKVDSIDEEEGGPETCCSELIKIAREDKSSH